MCFEMIFLEKIHTEINLRPREIDLHVLIFHVFRGREVVNGFTPLVNQFSCFSP